VAVTPNRPHHELSLAAAKLSRAAPNQWEQFVKAFEMYTAVAVQACVAAPPDKVLIAQGQARQSAEILNLLNEAIATANAQLAKP
jgi:hypothetical protein